MAQPFLAEVDGQAVAGLIAYRYGRRAWYLYGMSSSAHREAMPNHALQWAAIRWARDAGCETYDFWGAEDQRRRLWGARPAHGFMGPPCRPVVLDLLHCSAARTVVDAAEAAGQDTSDG
jgi:hypothetical protein